MSIVQNRKAFHDYFIEERYEAGLALDGWEVKAIRAGIDGIGINPFPTNVAGVDDRRIAR